MTARYKLRYMVQDSFRNVRENLLNTVLSVITVGVSLAVFAFFSIVFSNLNAFVEKWGDRTHAVVYVKSEALKDGPEALTQRLMAVPGVKEVVYVSSESAFQFLKGELKGHESLLDGVGAEQLPASFEVKFSPSGNVLEAFSVTAERLKRLGWVEDVDYGASFVEKFASFVRFLEFGSVFLGIFLAVAAMFLISNTIRLTIYARRDEIEIMRYLGASEAFVKIPFLMEGMFAGAVGGWISLLAIYAAQTLFAAYVPKHFLFLVANPLPFFTLFYLLTLGGACIGGIGSFISLGRFLKT
ncbi:MAG: permease-like cell division protein FtsX [Thermodesulfobacteriota bacterium]